MIVVTLMYLSGFECQFSDVSVTNLNGVQDCYVYIALGTNSTRFHVEITIINSLIVSFPMGGGAISGVMLFVRMVSTLLTTLMCL